LIDRHKLEVNAVIGQQAQAAMARVLQANDSLGAEEHFQREDGLAADLADHLVLARTAGVKHSRQVRPNVQKLVSAGHAAGMVKESSQPIDRAGHACQRHRNASFR